MMGWGWNGWMGGLGMGFGMIFWLVVVGLGIWLLVTLLDRNARQTVHSASDTLASRYARGEISKAEYEQIKQDLSR